MRRSMHNEVSEREERGGKNIYINNDHKLSKFDF